MNEPYLIHYVIYIYMIIYIYVYIINLWGVCVCVCGQVHVCHRGMPVCVCVCARLCMCMCVCMHVYACTCVYVLNSSVCGYKCKAKEHMHVCMHVRIFLSFGRLVFRIRSHIRGQACMHVLWRVQAS